MFKTELKTHEDTFDQHFVKIRFLMKPNDKIKTKNKDQNKLSHLKFFFFFKRILFQELPYIKKKKLCIYFTQNIFQKSN